MNQQTNEEKAGNSGYSKLVLSLSNIFLILVFISGAFLLVFLMVIPIYHEARLKSQIGNLKSNAHDIMIAAERYSVDTCAYPSDPHLLESEVYLTHTPLVNPFTNQRMKLTAYIPGDTYCAIGYIPIIYNDYAYTFYVVAFGPEETPGYDIDKDGTPDHIVLTAQTGCDRIYNPRCDKFYASQTGVGPTPPLEEAIKDLKWVWR